MKNVRDQKERKGRKDGRQEGRKDGRKEGREGGREEGRGRKGPRTRKSPQGHIPQFYSL